MHLTSCVDCHADVMLVITVYTCAYCFGVRTLTVRTSTDIGHIHIFAYCCCVRTLTVAQSLCI